MVSHMNPTQSELMGEAGLCFDQSVGDMEQNLKGLKLDISYIFLSAGWPED